MNTYLAKIYEHVENHLVKKLRPDFELDQTSSSFGHDLVGSIDGIINKRLCGWVHRTSAPGRKLDVALIHKGEFLELASADATRVDLASRSLGDHAFFIRLGERTLSLLSSGQRCDVVALGPSGGTLGSVKANKHTTALRSIRDNGEQDTTTNILDRVTKRSNDKKLWQSGHDATPPKFHTLLEPAKFDLSKNKSRIGVPVPNKFLDHCAKRFSLGTEFRWQDGIQETEDLFFWGFAHSKSLLSGSKFPLSIAEIDYLNETILDPRTEFPFTRATWRYLEKSEKHLSDMEQKGDDLSIDNIVFWWSVELAYQLGAEDCLVPPRYAERLRRPSNGTDHYNSPMSVFMSQYRDRISWFAPRLSASLSDPIDLTCLILINALSRPDFLRYIPNSALENAFEPDDQGLSPFQRFIRTIDLGAQIQAPFTLQDYQNLPAFLGFDFSLREFRSVTEAGRCSVSRHPKPDPTNKVDVQIIGPFDAPIGLGQATRLTSTVLDRTGFGLNCVNFDIRSSAKKGFVTPIETSEPRAARVNIIHLNADILPSAFTQGPDIYSDAYNIGFFYWELSKVDPCQYLAFDLLDEVWVATDYGVDINQPFTKKPVVNVGMTFEQVPEIDREEARHFVSKLSRRSDRTFKVLLMFDSFSFVERKNPLGAIKAFLAAFDKSDDVALVIKTQNRQNVFHTEQLRIWEEIDRLIEGDRRISFVNETLSYSDVMKLVRGCDCLLSLHRSEGLGFGLMEAMALEVPVICTGYSGNMDFCDETNSWPVDFDLIPVQPGQYIYSIPKGSEWADPRIESAVDALKDVWAHPEKRAQKVQKAKTDIETNFGVDAIAKRFRSRIEDILASLEN